MITRSHQKGDAASTATYSDCESYRYSLTRIWDMSGKRALFIMLNPSKATEIQNDPTIERCERRARALGYGSFKAANIFALRETDPHAMRRAPAPIGHENDAALIDAAHWADTIICGWGVHGAHLNRGPLVTGMLRETGRALHVLGLTRHGHPRHPLYISYATRPVVWHG